VEVTYFFPHDAGAMVAHYDAMYHDDSFSFLTPGVFNFSETRAYPELLGAFDDGLADGVTASALRKTREFRLEYQRKAFESKWARGTWGVGYRQVSHARAMGISYLAIVPNLPPVIPPVVPNNQQDRFAPLPDTVSQTSNFYGHGIGASLNLEFPLHPRVSVISGLAIGLIRGTAGSQYVSTSSFYFSTDAPGVPLTKDELFTILSSGSETQISNVFQQPVVHATLSPGASQMATTYDVYLGLQVMPYRGFRVFATVRDVYYSNVGEYVVPKPGPVNERTSLSAGYEGYVVGLSWRF
jgi:hypothetical protein